jgi:hypothetical protein
VRGSVKIVDRHRYYRMCFALVLLTQMDTAVVLWRGVFAVICLLLWTSSTMGASQNIAQLTQEQVSIRQWLCSSSFCCCCCCCYSSFSTASRCSSFLTLAHALLAM